MDHGPRPGRLLRMLALVGAIAGPGLAGAGDRPNIVWITAEDLSPDLGCYGDGYATTPELDAFARESVRYSRAFATAPVCSPARACLITGVYATSLGTQHLRSLFPIPSEIRGFPEYLRRAGYYCTNNVKTDYNTANEPAIAAASWDESSAQAHWRNRQPDQPFFSVFNLMTTHQSRSSVWSYEQFEKNIGSRLSPEERHDPASVPLPPYYPDTPLSRRAMARYYDCITVLDSQVGGLLRELEESDLAADTIVFFYGDHGMGMPRGKRLLHDSGLRVPLIIRFPDRFRHLAPAAAGEIVDRLVSFVDFPPTVLSLAGLEAPDYMQGRTFLRAGAATRERERVFGARDRVDEVYELSRSVRGPRFLYIRNYMPHLSWAQPEGYSDASPMRREILRLAAAGKLDRAQMTYAGPTKPIEELYDTLEDPHQIHNLIDRAEHLEVLNRLRRHQRAWSIRTRDLGFLPESEIWKRIGERTPWELARDRDRYPLGRLLQAAELVGRPERFAEQLELLKDADSGIRYWAAMGLHAGRADTPAVRSALRSALKDESAPVRIEAAAALIRLGESQEPLRVLTAALEDGPRLDTTLRAARTLQLLGEAARPARAPMRRVLATARERKGSDPLWLFIQFSLEAALKRLEERRPANPPSAGRSP